MADKKANKGVTVRLTAGDGSQLKVMAKVHKGTGQATSFVQHSSAKNADGKRSHSKGATQVHDSLAKATTAVDELVRVALTRGWVRPVSNGFLPKADAFDAQHIPVAPKAVAAPTPTGKK